MEAYCYILFSVKLNKYYVGSTPDLERRLSEHNRWKEKFTRTGMPWVLVYKEMYNNLAESRKREFEIKKKKSRKYIEQITGAA